MAGIPKMMMILQNQIEIVSIIEAVGTSGLRGTPGNNIFWARNLVWRYFRGRILHGFIPVHKLVHFTRIFTHTRNHSARPSLSGPRSLRTSPINPG